MAKLVRPLLSPFVGLSRSLARSVLPAAPPAPLVLSYGSYLRQRPLLFALWLRLRRLRYAVRQRIFPAGNGWRQIEFKDKAAKAHLTEQVIPHNVNHMWGVSRDRTERIINILRTVRGLDIPNSKVLCVGPRNEAELLLLSLYGFPLKNITAIDLFSCSPLIQVMDMHDLEFPDSHFDILYSSYVVRYSNDIRRACAEAVRVVRDSGLIAVGFTFPIDPKEDGNLAGTRLEGGLKELHSYFGDHVRHVYWQEEYLQGGKDVIATTVFSVAK